MPSKLEQPKLPLPVSKDLSELRCEIGFWSGKEVLFNPTNAIIVLDQDLTINGIQSIIAQSLSKNLQNSVRKIFDRITGNGNERISKICIEKSSKLSKFFTCKYFVDFQDKKFQIRNQSISWKLVGSWLQENHPNDTNLQEKILIEQIIKTIEYYPQTMRFHSDMKTDWVHLLHPDLTLLLSQINTIEELLSILSILRRYSLNRINKSNELQYVYFEKYKLEYSARLPHVAMNLANSSTLVLIILAYQKKILLPYYLHEVIPALDLLQSIWLTKNGTTGRIFLSRLICSSTIRQPEDIPELIHDLLQGIPEQKHINNTFHELLFYYQKQHDLPVWPLHKLNRIRAKSSNGISIVPWSPGWLENKGINADWVKFAHIFWQVNNSTDIYKSSALSGLLRWALDIGFNSPNEIKLSDLRNINQPNDQRTFFYFCENLESSQQSVIWSRAGSVFDSVYNTLKVVPDSLIKAVDNPFASLENPFKSSLSNKTSRNRMDTVIHELMINILLDPDENGHPTYNWVKNNFKYDWFEWLNPKTKEIVKIWCPSRTICLALLLLLPIRQKQARWLDRGLMDKHIWDIESDTWQLNNHPLSSWQYPNGNLHGEQYGRCSGVLQSIIEPMTNKSNISIYINTNKTRMWDRRVKTGYAIPWLTGANIQSNTLDINRQVQLLERPYQIIKFQILFQNTYNPFPEPVSFFDIKVEAERQNINMKGKSPCFTPLFSDLSDKYYKQENSSKMYYPPVSSAKIYKLFDALALEAEQRLNSKGLSVQLTTESIGTKGYKGRACLYDIHSLRISGISRLIEMGIPVDVVQEFIAGHTTPVMTLYYLKHSPNWARMQILDKMLGADLLDGWDPLCKTLTSNQKFFVTNSRSNVNRPQNLLNNYVGWKQVDGGICPLGGTECYHGLLIEKVSENGKVTKTYGPVIGGCGNCRFFSTGPAFLIQQAQSENQIMLELRLLGKQQEQLRAELNKLDWQDIDTLEPKKKQVLTLERQLLKDNIAEIDIKLEPLIIEWINRYKMIEESMALLEDWKKLTNNEGLSKEKYPLLLIAGADVSDFHKEIETRFEKSGDFSLVRNIMTSAKLRGGLAKDSSIAKEHLREFVDRILRVENSKFLLMDIRDKRLLDEAAFLMASLLESLVGDNAIQDSLDQNQPLNLDKKTHKLLISWAEEVVTMANTENNQSLKISDLLPKHLRENVPTSLNGAKI